MAGVLENHTCQDALQHASTLSLPNLYYLLRRTGGQRAARKALGVVRDIFRLVPLDLQITQRAIDADIKDFEDAIQFFIRPAHRCRRPADPQPERFSRRRRSCPNARRIPGHALRGMILQPNRLRRDVNCNAALSTEE